MTKTVTGFFLTPEEIEARASGAFEAGSGSAFVPNEFSVSLFDELSKILTAHYKSSALSDIFKPEPIAFREEKAGRYVIRFPNEAHPPVHIAEDKVTADVSGGKKLTAKAADFMAAAAKANGSSGKPLYLRGSDEEKIHLMIAAQKHGIQVANAKEIEAIAKTKPDLLGAVQAEWIKHNAQGESPMNTPDETRKAFDLPVGVVALKMGLVDEAGQENAAAKQADLLAIALKLPKGDDTKLGFLKPDQIAAKKQELGITDVDVKDARAVVDSKKGVPDNVPKIGMLLDIDRDTKNAIFVAQAAVRTLNIVDRVEKGDVPSATEQDVADFYKNPMFGAVGKFPDPVAVTNAQTLNAMAALYEKKVGAGLEKEPKVMGFKSSALDSLNVAATQFRALGYEQVGEKLDAIRQSYDKPAGGTGPRPVGPGVAPA